MVKFHERTGNGQENDKKNERVKEIDNTLKEGQVQMRFYISFSTVVELPFYPAQYTRPLDDL